MAKIIVIDDDFAAEILIENLSYLGHDARRLRSMEEALAALDQIVMADLLILDIIMPRSENVSGVEISGGRTAGMAIFQAVRKRKADLPTIVHSATSDTDIVSALKRDKHTLFLPKWSMSSMQTLIAKIEEFLGPERSRTFPKSFIVHGRDETAKLALKNYIQNTLKLPEPIILHEQANLGRTLIEKFEHHAAGVHLAFVLLTPDDKVVPFDAPNEEKRRARQNVIFELGFFLGTLGRQSGRVFLLHKGPLELPSDLSGVVYIDIGHGIDAAGEHIRKELEHVL
jgi:predicted nucleotide-binding protein